MKMARLKLEYDGTDISTEISSFVTRFQFTDNAADKADDISITLEDRAGLWKGSWFPQKGAKLHAELIQTDLATQKETRLVCGDFEIDEIEMSADANGGDTVTLKAVAIVITKPVCREKKTRGWENCTLEAVARQIAEESGLELQFEADKWGFDRLDQREESDLAFLKRLCMKYGLSLKVADRKLIIYSGEEYEKAPSILVLNRSDLTSYRLKSKSADIFRAANMMWQDPETGAMNAFIYTPPNAPKIGQILKINERAKSDGEAEQIAKSKLQKANKMEVSGSISLAGDLRITAAATFCLNDLGIFSGKYFAEKVTHEMSRDGGLATSAEIRKIKDGEE